MGQGIQPTGTLDATAMKSRVARHTDHEIEIEFDHPQASVRATLALAGSPGGIECALAVTPCDPILALARVDYPVIATPNAEAGREKFCLLPYREGRLTPLSLPLSYEKTLSFFTYPKHLIAQMIACLGGKGGFLLWTDDQLGHVKDFGGDHEPKSSVFRIRHFFAYEPGKARGLSYRARLTFTGPDWQDAADVYRDWAVQQDWCATKLKDRKDVPAFLHHPHYNFNESIVPWPGQAQNLDTLPDRLAEIRQRLQVPVVVRAVRWEKHGGWIGIDYFPPVIGEARLRSLASELKARRILLILELSGYRWQSGEDGTVVDKTNRLNQPQKDALKRFFQENQGPQVCEQQRDGRLNPVTTICRGSSFGRSFMQNMAARLFDLGSTGFHGDQDSGPTPDGVTGCFNPDHGHPIPCGPWSIENTRQAYREIRAEAARRGISDFLLTKEHCTEVLNMELHGYLARMEWTTSQPHVVPRSQFLYHEFIPVVLDPVTDGLADQIILGVVAAARDATSPLFAEYCRAMQAYAKDFLLYGRMLKPLLMDVPVSRRPVTGKTFLDGKRGATADISIPAIRHSAWDDGAGNIGVFAINTQPKEMTVKVPVPGKGKWRATFYLGSLPQQTQAVTAGNTLEWTLAPGRIAAIVFQPGNSR